MDDEGNHRSVVLGVGNGNVKVGFSGDELPNSSTLVSTKD